MEHDHHHHFEPPHLAFGHGHTHHLPIHDKRRFLRALRRQKNVRPKRFVGVGLANSLEFPGSHEGMSSSESEEVVKTKPHLTMVWDVHYGEPEKLGDIITPKPITTTPMPITHLPPYIILEEFPSQETHEFAHDMSSIHLGESDIHSSMHSRAASDVPAPEETPAEKKKRSLVHHYPEGDILHRILAGHDHSGGGTSHRKYRLQVVQDVSDVGAVGTAKPEITKRDADAERKKRGGDHISKTLESESYEKTLESNSGSRVVQHMHEKVHESLETKTVESTDSDEDLVLIGARYKIITTPPPTTPGPPPTLPPELTQRPKIILIHHSHEESEGHSIGAHSHGSDHHSASFESVSHEKSATHEFLELHSAELSHASGASDLGTHPQGFHHTTLHHDGYHHKRRRKRDTLLNSRRRRQLPSSIRRQLADFSLNAPAPLPKTENTVFGSPETSFGDLEAPRSALSFPGPDMNVPVADFDERQEYSPYLSDTLSEPYSPDYFGYKDNELENPTWPQPDLVAENQYGQYSAFPAQDLQPEFQPGFRDYTDRDTPIQINEDVHVFVPGGYKRPSTSAENGGPSTNQSSPDQGSNATTSANGGSLEQSTQGLKVTGTGSPTVQASSLSAQIVTGKPASAGPNARAVSEAPESSTTPGDKDDATSPSSPVDQAGTTAGNLFAQRDATGATEQEVQTATAEEALSTTAEVSPAVTAASVALRDATGETRATVAEEQVTTDAGETQTTASASIAVREATSETGATVAEGQASTGAVEEQTTPTPNVALRDATDAQLTALTATVSLSARDATGETGATVTEEQGTQAAVSESATTAAVEAQATAAANVAVREATEDTAATTVEQTPTTVDAMTTAQSNANAVVREATEGATTTADGTTDANTVNAVTEVQATTAARLAARDATEDATPAGEQTTTAANEEATTAAQTGAGLVQRAAAEETTAPGQTTDGTQTGASLAKRDATVATTTAAEETTTASRKARVMFRRYKPKFTDKRIDRQAPGMRTKPQAWLFEGSDSDESSSENIESMEHKTGDTSNSKRVKRQDKTVMQNFQMPVARHDSKNFDSHSSSGSESDHHSLHVKQVSHSSHETHEKMISETVSSEGSHSHPHDDVVIFAFMPATTADPKLVTTADPLITTTPPPTYNAFWAFREHKIHPVSSESSDPHGSFLEEVSAEEPSVIHGDSIEHHHHEPDYASFSAKSKAEWHVLHHVNKTKGKDKAKGKDKTKGKKAPEAIAQSDEPNKTPATKQGRGGKVVRDERPDAHERQARSGRREHDFRAHPRYHHHGHGHHLGHLKTVGLNHHVASNSLPHSGELNNVIDESASRVPIVKAADEPHAAVKLHHIINKRAAPTEKGPTSKPSSSRRPTLLKFISKPGIVAPDFSVQSGDKAADDSVGFHFTSASEHSGGYSGPHGLNPEFDDIPVLHKSAEFSMNPHTMHLESYEIPPKIANLNRAGMALLPSGRLPVKNLHDFVEVDEITNILLKPKPQLNGDNRLMKINPNLRNKQSDLPVFPEQNQK